MNKKAILLTGVILLTVGATVNAQEGGISGTFDVTYSSRYIWRGFDVYNDNHSALQPSIDLDLYGTGLGLKVFWSRANGSKFENLEELDLTLSYGNTFAEGEAYATAYQVGWTYFTYPDEPGSEREFQEFFASLSMPELCPAGIVPSYTVFCMWPSEGGSARNANGGFIHVFGLGYDLTVPELAPEIPELVVNLSANFVYNDGVGAGYTVNGAVAHDWSHVVFGASTDIDLGNNLSFCPGLYHQISMEDSVNENNETWVSLSLKYNF
jgi:hypothetical protein